jgi:hypothetical protein
MSRSRSRSQSPARLKVDDLVKMQNNLKEDEGMYILNVARGNSDFEAQSFFRRAKDWRVIDGQTHQLTYVRPCNEKKADKDWELFVEKRGEGDLFILP